MSRCAVGMGSNVGDRLAHLSAALAGLRAVSEVVAVSSVYETAPVGGPVQGAFLNAVALLETGHTPLGLLSELLAIERARGRERRERWGPRTLDLDLLLWAGEMIRERHLAVPHPRMSERRFVLDPLLEVWPDATLPDGSPVAAGTRAVQRQSVERLGHRLECADAAAT